jgi:ElaB/YqjD/DUF883 family membrane-anchored ribosome-binding protein
MPETAAATGQPGSGSGGENAAEQVQDKAREVAGQAQETARETGQQVRERLREEVDQRSTQAGEQVRGNAEDVRSFAQQLREQGKDAPARYVEQAADRAEKVGDYLERSDGERILNDVESFARSNPWAVVAGGVAIGFAVSRMLKASSGERYRASLGDGGNGVGESTAVQVSVPSNQELVDPTRSPGTRGDVPVASAGTPPSQFDPRG